MERLLGSIPNNLGKMETLGSIFSHETVGFLASASLKVSIKEQKKIYLKRNKERNVQLAL